jgi:hypothetical protein
MILYLSTILLPCTCGYLGHFLDLLGLFLPFHCQAVSTCILCWSRQDHGKILTTWLTVLHLEIRTFFGTFWPKDGKFHQIQCNYWICEVTDYTNNYWACYRLHFGRNSAFFLLTVVYSKSVSPYTPLVEPNRPEQGKILTYSLFDRHILDVILYKFLHFCKFASAPLPFPVGTPATTDNKFSKGKFCLSLLVR